MKTVELTLDFQLGQNIDVKDTTKKWVNGEIIFIKGSQVYIHYSGWSAKFDEYISIHSDRILTQWQHGKQLKINNRVDAFHPFSGWLQARVIDIQYNKTDNKIKQIKVHYFNYHPKYDRWVDPYNINQIDIIGSKSKAYGIGKSRSKRKTKTLTLSQLTKKILEMKVKNMIQELGKDDFVIHNTEGDGNCLFRSISHQLYGKQDYHLEIRLLCMKYIKNQQVFFQNYVTENFQEYVKQKSCQGVWGDDVEIQALSQIYGRPIEIYATSSKPLRTFHQDNQHKIEPLRLAYVGNSHYNSIKPKDKDGLGLLDSPFGEFQLIFSKAYELKEFDYNLIRHRDFFSRTNGIDLALQQNVNAVETKQQNLNQQLLELQNKQINQAIEISQAENILQQIEKSQMKEIQNKYQQEQIQQQLRRIQQKQIDIARQLSKKIKKDPSFDRPYWFADLLSQGFKQQEILFAIQIVGYDPDLVQNFLIDNM